MIIPDDRIVPTFEALCEMNTTLEIAREVERLLANHSLISGEAGMVQMVAVITLAQITSGKASINLQNVN